MRCASVTSVGHCITRADMRIIDADAYFCDLFGVDAESLHGRSALDLTHPDDRVCNRERLEDLHRTGRPFAITKRYLRPDGTSFWVRNHVSKYYADRRGDTLMATVEAVAAVPAAIQSALLKLAKRVQHRRQVRGACFGTEIASDAALDMLIELFVKRCKNAPVCVSDLCHACFTPYTTALRELGRLESEGLLVRSGDPNDRRRTTVSLTDRGMDLMFRYLSSLQRADARGLMATLRQ